MKRIAFLILCLASAAWCEEAKPIPLSADDEKLAVSLLNALSDDEFDKRAKTQQELTKLVFSDPKKATAWDNWLAEVKKRTTDAEALSRLPSDVATRTRLCGRYKSDDRHDVASELEISIDGTFKVYRKRQLLVLQGKFTVQRNGSVLLKGTPIDRPKDWEATASLRDDKLTLHVKVDDSEFDSTWTRMPAEVQEEKQEKKKEDK
jgi:hypothetical protein